MPWSWRADLRVGRFQDARGSVRAWPLHGNPALPVLHPLAKAGHGHPARRAEQMDVIRHDDVIADAPEVRQRPFPGAECLQCVARQERAPVFRTYIHLNNDRLVEPLNGRMVGWMVTYRVSLGLHLPPGPHGGGPSTSFHCGFPLTRTAPGRPPAAGGLRGRRGGACRRVPGASGRRRRRERRRRSCAAGGRRRS